MEPPRGVCLAPEQLPAHDTRLGLLNREHRF